MFVNAKVMALITGSCQVLSGNQNDGFLQSLLHLEYIMVSTPSILHAKESLNKRFRVFT